MKTFARASAVVLFLGTGLAGMAAHAASSDPREALHDARGNAVLSSLSGKCVRVEWDNSGDECNPTRPVIVKAEAPPPPPPPAPPPPQKIAQEERTVYFAFDRALLNPDSKERLNNLATRLKSDEQVKDASVVGFADHIGNAGYNEKLSKKRAETVKSYLVAKGFVKATTVQTRWLGESVPATNCPDTLKRQALIDCLQHDRRVEVEINYYPQVTASTQQ